jgi:predicted transcriptional regulator
MEILKVLWELGPSTVRDVHRHQFQAQDLAYNTIQTLLRLMADPKKGLVSAQLDGRTWVYTACYSRDQIAARFVDDVFDGAGSEMVMSLIRSERVSADELDTMRQMIDTARRQNGRNRQGGVA